MNFLNYSIDFKKLEVFVKVFETRSFSKASKSLHLSQPSITLHIRELEELLGVKLFVRTTRKVIPTQAGEIFYKYAKKLLELKKNLVKEIQVFKEDNTKVLRIGGSNIPGQYILPKLIKNFFLLNPGVSVYIKVGDSKEIFEMVLKEELSFGMTGTKFDIKGFHYIKCYGDEIVLIAPPDFSKEKIQKRELYEIPLIKREEGSATWKCAMEALGKEGIDVYRLKIIGEMGSTEAIKNAVKAGLGCGFVSNLAIEEAFRLGKLKVIEIEDVKIRRNFYLVYPKGKKFSSLEEKFINFLLNEKIKTIF